MFLVPWTIKPQSKIWFSAALTFALSGDIITFFLKDISAGQTVGVTEEWTFCWKCGVMEFGLQKCIRTTEFHYIIWQRKSWGLCSSKIPGYGLLSHSDQAQSKIRPREAKLKQMDPNIWLLSIYMYYYWFI